MAYDHECFACGGKGTRETPGFDYEWVVPLHGGQPIEIRHLTGQKSAMVECSDCHGRGISSGHEGTTPEACPACKSAREALGPLIESIRGALRPATLLKFIPASEADSLPIVGTKLGGIPYAEMGETWPHCPRCSSELTFIGQFDTRRASVAPVGLVTFFYCWECRPSGLREDLPGTWTARIHQAPDLAKTIRIEPKKKPPQETRPCFASELPILSHPDWDEVEKQHPKLFAIATRLSGAEPYAPYRAAVEALLGDYRITNQLGGYGRWIQYAPRKDCKTCGAGLEFTLQIDSHAEAKCDWGLSGLAYLLACRAHPSELALDIQRT